MNYEQFTLKAQEALRDAASIAQKNDHSSIEPEHLLLALLDQEGGVVSSILERLGVDRAKLEQRLSDLLKTLPKAYGEATQVYFSPAMQKVIAKAESESESMKDEFVASEHLF
ncbi:MAG TPA: Clp protease N-terminal domain-containing protein, partial [Rectinema sp.]|nr:Clp protease N-terminal domain-containing protein [Rectinema sp.]